MAYTFAIDTKKLNDLSDSLNSTSSTVGTEIGSIYSGIDSMGTGDTWSGSSYETFKKGAHQYEAALKTVPEVINAFSSHFSMLSEKGATTITAIQAQIDSIE